MNGRLRSLVLCLTALAVLALMYTQILPIIQERLSPAPAIRTGHSSTNTVPAVRATARIQNNLILTVKRANGETETIVKEGDPWTANLAKLILDVLLGGHYGGTAQAFTCKGGTTGTMISTESRGLNPSFAIGIGNGTSPFSVDDYKLANEIAFSDVPSEYISFNDNGTCYNINITQSFTVSNAVNITEIGLFIKINVLNVGTDYLLLSRDLIDPPVQLLANDTISVLYALYFPYGIPPFTKQFYGLMLNYIFCLRAYGYSISFKCTDGTSTSLSDFGIDEPYSSGGGADYVSEKLYGWLGSGSSIFGYDSYTLLNKISTTVSDTPFSLTYNATHAIFETKISHSLATANTISEVGFVIQSIDIDIAITSDIDRKTKQVLVLYFVLDNPVYVESGGTFKFKCEIVLPLAG